MMPPVLVPTLAPERVECRLVGEVAPRAEIFRIGRVLKRRNMRVEGLFLAGVRQFMIGVAQIVMTQIAMRISSSRMRV